MQLFHIARRPEQKLPGMGRKKREIHRNVRQQTEEPQSGRKQEEPGKVAGFVYRMSWIDVDVLF